MKETDLANLPSELTDLGERLCRERPELSPAELQRIQATLSFGQKPERRKETPLKARIAVVLALASGMIFGAGGLAMGVTALQDTDNAAVSQYSPCDDGSSSEDCGGSLGGAASGPGGNGSIADQATAASISRRAEGAESLPFTGYLAIPALLVGVLFVLAGLGVRKAALRSDESR